MPFTYSDLDCSPLVIDKEFDINNDTILAEYIGKILLGHYAHVKRIINALSSSIPTFENSDIDFAIAKLKETGKTKNEIEKRDGWVFQIISWLALFVAHNGEHFYCQQPHDAPAQHGLDGVAILLDKQLTLKNIIITEDKCTEHHRVIIPEIWKEFIQFEKGVHNNQIVSRVSALLENLEGGNVLEANRNDIYKKERWKYRIGINRNEKYQKKENRKKLFKGYDNCVTGTFPHRRYSSTIYKDNIREWMEQLCQKVITFLESQKITNV